MEQIQHHIVMLPSPGMGHLIPMLQLAKLLLSRYNFSTTFLVPTIGDPPMAQTSLLETLPDDINHILLPPIDLSDQPHDVKPTVKICLGIIRSIPSIREVMSLLMRRTRIAAFIMDMFGTDCFEVALEFDVPPYLYFPPNATFLTHFLHLPELDKRITCEYRDFPEPVILPGCVPVYGKDFIDSVQDRKNEAYKWILRISNNARRPVGIMVNSFVELEPGPLRALLEEEPGRPPVYPIGPIVQSDGSDNEPDRSGCLSWLDDQPDGSVLYVAFGSGGTLSSNQLNELAIGLEMSGRRFLWVVKSPNDRSANAALFSVQSEVDPLGFLPQGFVERTKDCGFLVPSWVPQVKVLAHRATGGFLTHCGWNSTLESITNGVPMIAWPLYAEQKINALMLSEQTKAVLRPKTDENGFYTKEEISRVVKELMEGEEGKKVRDRVTELSNAARKALSDDGTSTKALNQVVMKWKEGVTKPSKVEGS